MYIANSQKGGQVYKCEQNLTNKSHFYEHGSHWKFRGRIRLRSRPQVEDEHLNATQNALWAVGTSLIHPQILQILNKSVYYTLCYEYCIRTKSNTEQLLVLHQREQILHTIFKYCNRGHKSMSHQNSFKWHQNIAGVRSTCSSSVEKMLWRAYGSRLVWLGRPNSSPATRAVSATGCSSM